MIDLIRPQGAGKSKPSSSSTQIRIVLEGSEPEIWRRLIVPSNANLGWLHAVIQIAMGWTNSHLHQFRCGDKLISDPKFNLDEFENDPPVLDERKVQLNELIGSSDEILLYEYDFGDSWTHLIMVEDPSQPPRGVAGKAVCVDGARACPPEDCGGVPGYADLLEALQNRKHPEHKARCF